MPKYDKILVKKYGRVFGCFDGTLPNLWTTDADLIKSIFVKDFDHFINRRVNNATWSFNELIFFQVTVISIMGLWLLQEFIITQKVIRKMISLIQDQEWKDVRTSITPAFTTGKIKRVRTVSLL